MPDDDFTSLPFAEAQEHLRQKINLPSARWADVLGAAHTRAFTVAGATKEGMLVDFRAAIQSALDNGDSLKDFQKSFDDIVQKYGWSYNGTRGWRSKLIYETNVATAYQAGRYQQMTDPDVRRLQPYWQWRHSDNVTHPRPLHEQWDGLVLRWDDPWVKTHYTPAGWGCHCTWEPLSARELSALGKSGPDQAPPSDDRDVTLQTSSGPVTVSVPAGVDPGWGHVPDSHAHASAAPSIDSPMMAWDRSQDDWEILPPFDSQGGKGDLPVDHVPVDQAPAKPPIGATPAQVEVAVTRTIGGQRQALPLPDGSHVEIGAAELAQHVDQALAPFVPALPSIAAEPAEIWLAFERSGASGKVVVRKRILKLIQTADGRRLLMMLQASAGRLEAWKLLAGDEKQIQANRVGRMVWSRLGER